MNSPHSTEVSKAKVEARGTDPMRCTVCWKNYTRSSLGGKGICPKCDVGEVVVPDQRIISSNWCVECFKKNYDGKEFAEFIFRGRSVCQMHLEDLLEEGK